MHLSSDSLIHGLRGSMFSFTFLLNIHSWEEEEEEEGAWFSRSADRGFRRHRCLPLHGPRSYRQRFQLIYISCFYLLSVFN